MSRRSRAIGSLMSFTLLLAACTSGTGESPTASEPAEESAPAASESAAASEAPAADLEDTLTVLCTPQEDWCQVMVERFEEEFGVDTNYVRLSSGEALARLQAGAESPEFSVWWGGPADGFVAANAEGCSSPTSPPTPRRFPTTRRMPMACGPASTSARSASARTPPSSASWAWTSPPRGMT